MALARTATLSLFSIKAVFLERRTSLLCISAVGKFRFIEKFFAQKRVIYAQRRRTAGMLCVYLALSLRERRAPNLSVVCNCDCGNYACVRHLFEQFIRELQPPPMCFVERIGPSP